MQVGRVLHECFWAEVLYLEQKEKYLANTEQLGFGEKGKGGCALGSKGFSSTIVMSSPNHRTWMSGAGFRG